MSSLAFLLLGLPLPEDGTLELRIVERDAQGRDRPLPARVHLTGPDGKAVKVPGLPFFHDHASCEGVLSLRAAPGAYEYMVERGPEYRRGSGRIEVSPGKTAAANIALERWIDLAGRGWWSGETHVHRPPEDAGLLLRAEDLHAAPIITVWNRRSLWTSRPLPADPLVVPDPLHAYHLLACEDERQGGALLYFNLTKPLDLAGDDPEHPSPVKHLREALEQPGARIDIEKPFWWDVPTWVATGKIGTIGIANNHMCRGGMYEDEAWGRPRDAGRLPSPRGNGFYTQEIYYRLLNCGFRLSPSAGSASGVLPNPVGYNRAYVRIDGPFSYEAWWKGLAAGRSFVTNGPILLVEANGRPPGDVLASSEGRLEVALDIFADENDPFESVEVIRDGRVVEKIDWAGDLRGRHRPNPLIFERSGWFLVRVIARVPETFRFASTAPFHVEVGPRRRTIHRDDVKHFLGWIDERIERIQRAQDLGTAGQKEDVLAPHRAARKVFEDLLSASVE